MKKLLLILVLFVCHYLLFSKQVGNFSVTVSCSGDQRVIYCYVPENYDSTKAYPMLWGWGAGMAGTQMVERLKLMQDEIKGIIVCPDLNGLSGNAYDCVADYSYNFIRENYNIDTTKIVITGYSLGGMKSYQIGLKKPHLARGIIGLAPALRPMYMSQEMWANITKVRMATIMGTKDALIKDVKPLMEEIQEKGGSLLFIEKAGLDHEGSNGYYNTLEFVEDFIQCYNFVISIPANSIAELPPNNGAAIISPNPSSTYIKVDTELPGQVQIINPSGITVMETESGRQTDISGLPQGIYFIKTAKSIKKFVKM